MMYLQSFNQRYQKHVTFLPKINFLEIHWSHCRNKLVASHLFNSYVSVRFLPLGDCFYSNLSMLLTALCQCCFQEKIVLLQVQDTCCLSLRFAHVLGSVSKTFQRVLMAYYRLFSTGISLKPVCTGRINRHYF